MGILEDLEEHMLANMKDDKEDTKLTIVKPDGEVVESTNFIAFIDRENMISSVLNINGTSQDLTNMSAAIAKALSHILDRATGRHE